MLTDLDDLMVDFGVDALFLEGYSIHKPNLYYVTQFLTVDKIYYTKLVGLPPVLTATDLVCERARKLSMMRDFHSTSPIWDQALREGVRREEIDKRIVTDIAKQLLPRNGIVGIPRDTDALAVQELKRSSLTLHPVHSLFLQARETKSQKEIRAIEKASHATELTFKQIIEVFQNTTVAANRVLLHNGEPLTVGQVKRFIEHALVDNDSENSEESIVAGGSRSADYHYLGQRNDRLRADEPIIIDIYPRRIEERYHADITRTIVRGNVKPQVKKMLDAVEASLDAVLDTVTIGGTTTELVNAMGDTLEHYGYQSVHRTPGVKQGMIHGLGHGIGLEVHEQPRLSVHPSQLREGAVIAVEPGLYYKRIGGVRIEDDAIITKKGAKRLTKLPRTFHL